MKRVMDFCLAAALLGLLSPVFLLVAIITGSQKGFPLLRKVRRPGLHGRPFKLYEFHSVYEGEPPEFNMSSISTYRRSLGKFLRRYNFDKIPQLLNVLRGEMSFVGPSPATYEYLASCHLEQVRRFHAKPGITGWEQINGCTVISSMEKNRLDLWYVDHQNIKLDFLILWLTINKCINPTDIDALGIARRENFFPYG